MKGIRVFGKEISNNSTSMCSTKTTAITRHSVLIKYKEISSSNKNRFGLRFFRCSFFLIIDLHIYSTHTAKRSARILVVNVPITRNVSTSSNTLLKCVIVWLTSGQASSIKNFRILTTSD